MAIERSLSASFRELDGKSHRRAKPRLIKGLI
jgi:hypothetical protein